MKTRTIKRITKSGYLLLLTAVMLTACRTIDARDEPLPLTEISREQIEQNILNGNPFDAIQDLDSLKRRGTEIPGSQLQALEQNAASALKTMFQDSINTEDYGKALSIYRSAVSLSMSKDYNGWSQSRILTESAKAMLEKGDAVAAYLTFDSALQLGDVSEEDADFFFKRATQDGYTPLIEHLLASGLVTAPTEDVTPPGKIEPDTLLGGTATILVNRGIRMDAGIGYPDSVIGSGFFIDSRGYMLTNYHIIESEVSPKYEGFSRLYVLPHNSESTKIPAKVVGWDPVLDLALLKTEIKPDYVFPVDPTVTYRPGDVIYAIGSPGGLKNTVTSGIVSAIGRKFLQIGTTLQVDVPVNPGNSGGPLIDAQGRLIGVVFAGIEQFEGINFAIPTKWVVHVIPDLFTGGEVVHSWLGMTVEETVRGLEVSYVLPGGPAGRAGIAQGDIVTSIYGKEVNKVEDVQQITIGLEPETLVEVNWKRNGSNFEGIVSLGKRPELPIDVARERDTITNLVAPLFGMVIEETGNLFWDKSYVVRRVYPGGIADETGLSVNDPLSIQGFQIDDENRVGYLQIVVKKKKAGFIERAIQLGTYLEIGNFI